MYRAFRSWWSSRSPASPRNEGHSRTVSPSEERDQRSMKCHPEFDRGHCARPTPVSHPCETTARKNYLSCGVAGALVRNKRETPVSTSGRLGVEVQILSLRPITQIRTGKVS